MGRFFAGYPWRFLVTDLNTVPVTMLDKLATNRAIALALDQASVIEGQVLSSDPRVNTVHSDGAPLLGQNSRLLYAFRREGGSPPWVVRAAGVVHNLQDQGAGEQAVTHFAAFDPWKLLEGRPAVNAAGSLPDDQGFDLTGQAGVIALTYLKNTIAFDGPVHLDAGTTYGGTSFYPTTAASIDTTTVVSHNAGQGQMVGQVWNELVSAGQFDIVLYPIWDPVNRPGYTHEVGVHALAGANRPEAVFGWDRMNRGAASWDRMHDGTPGSFINRAQYYIFEGAPAPVQVNVASQTAYGRYYAIQNFPDIHYVELGTSLAQQALQLAKQGKRTTTIDVMPQNSPISLVDYGLGDRVQLYASNKLRATAAGAQRVQAIPITVDDDGVEHVQGLLCSPDWRTGPS